MSETDGQTALVLCYGNPARGDDGLGPALAELLAAEPVEGVRIESDYQLLVEDAIAVSEASVVVFVDAAAAGPEPFEFRAIEARETGGYMAHSVGPAQLLRLACDLFGGSPDAYLLAIRGYSFAMFHEGLSRGAAANLDRAAYYLREFLGSGVLEAGEMRRQR
ncbi:hydrogenase maturation protease [Salinispira pacifica]